MSHGELVAEIASLIILALIIAGMARRRELVAEPVRGDGR